MSLRSLCGIKGEILVFISEMVCNLPKIGANPSINW